MLPGKPNLRYVYSNEMDRKGIGCTDDDRIRLVHYKIQGQVVVKAVIKFHNCMKRGDILE